LTNAILCDKYIDILERKSFQMNTRLTGLIALLGLSISVSGCSSPPTEPKKVETAKACSFLFEKLDQKEPATVLNWNVEVNEPPRSKANGLQLGWSYFGSTATKCDYVKDDLTGNWVANIVTINPKGDVVIGKAVMQTPANFLFEVKSNSPSIEVHMYLHPYRQNNKGENIPYNNAFLQMFN
jgi:hypothetical protein